MPRSLATAAIALVAALAPTTAHAFPTTPSTEQWTFNRSATVLSVLPTPSATYVGGRFTYVGPRTGSGLVTDAVSGDARPSMPVYDGRVSDALPDGAGGAYVAGSFTNLAGSGRSYLARLRPDGSVDPTFAPNPDGPVSAIARSGGTLYAAGSFDNIGGAARDGAGAVDANGVATAWNPAPNNAVTDLAASATSVYAVGYFSAIGGGAKSQVARLDPGSGALNGAFTAPAFGDDVFGVELAPNGTDLYVWGFFTNSVAQLSATTGAATAWNPQATGGRVNSLAVSADSSTVYLGGGFTQLKGQPRAALGAVGRTAAATLQTWSPTAAGALSPGPDTPFVSTLEVSGGDVYIGGSFLQVAGAPRHGAARVSAGGALAPWNPDLSDPANGFVALGGGDVLVAGEFLAARGVVRRNLAAVDARGVATPWNPDVSSTPPFQPHVSELALSPDGRIVYAGGDFHGVGGSPRRSLAAIDAASGNPTAFDAGLLYDPSPSFTSVTSIAAHPDGRLFVAGRFATAQGQARNGIAALSGQTGAPTAWNAGSNGESHALALAPGGGRLFVGGVFTTIGGAARPRLAALDTATAAATEWAPAPNVAIDHLAMAPDGSTVYPAAQFLSTIGSQAPQLARRNLAAVSTAGTGEALPSFDAAIPTTSDVVQAMAPSVDGTRLFVGGGFDAIGGQTRNGFAELSATTGVATPLTIPLPPFAQPRALAHSAVPGGDQLLVGGAFVVPGPRPLSAFMQLRDPAPPPSSPGQPPAPASPSAGQPKTAPKITRASLSRRRFAAARTARDKRRGTTVRFRLSEAADVHFTVLRRLSGRRASGRCRPRARQGRRCTITRAVGRLKVHAGRAGSNAVRFSGRVRGRALRPGPHLLQLRAIDADGKRSATVTLKFRVVRPRR